MSESIDVRLQVDLCLRALEAILPFASAAGIATNYRNAYDEWEEIVQSLYLSFVVRPVCDSGTHCSVQQFRRLGFETDGGATGVILVDVYPRTYFIFDIANLDDDHMWLVLRPLSMSDEDIFVLPENCANFRVKFLGEY